MYTFSMAFRPNPFVPPAPLRSGHRMTIYAWARRRRFPRLPAPAARVFDVGPDTRLLAKCHWQPDPPAHPTLLLLHGLEGSADSHYVRGIADKAFWRGFNVVRLNQRNCGGTDHLSAGVYHSGLTSDPAAVLRELVERDGLPSLAVIGYSLGGNLALRLAGEPAARGQPEVRAFAAVSPTLDLAACADALERRSNLLYQWNFVWDLRRRLRRKARLYPERYDTAPLRGVRTVRQFDDAYTAPLSGFRDAADYYFRASSLRVIGQARRPTLIITAEDDPFIPVEPFRSPEVVNNPAVTLVVTRHGGHCGFISSRATRRRGTDGYWAEDTVVRFAAEVLGEPAATHAHTS
jgi:predicted alpha/beta-fold hydrolase